LQKQNKTENGIFFQQKQPAIYSYNLGNDFRTNDPKEAVQKLLERDFPGRVRVSE
jgi:hypothetical protein